VPSLGLFGFLMFVIFHKGRIYLQGVEFCVCVCGGVMFVFGLVSGLSKVMFVLCCVGVSKNKV